MRIGRVWGKREEEREGQRQRGKRRGRGTEAEAAFSEEDRTERKKGRTNGDLLALVGRRRLGVGGACRLKGQVYPGDRADQQNYNYNIPVFFL